ncbi:zinc finger protein 69-like [Ylistrum balloti]|uniref:zinc finger protein 69-like n=1 Tax=Ylistrum balloti TaxID=509963 RepID=UPI00290598DD|nr:zinc finger protein 69-like [Ylistrum balloti]
MEAVSVNTFSSLDITFPLSFLKESLLAHESENADVIQWVAKDYDTKTTSIATQSNTTSYKVGGGEKQKVILISVKSVKFNILEGKIVCNFPEITRSVVIQEGGPSSERKTLPVESTFVHDNAVSTHESVDASSIDRIGTSSNFTDTHIPVKRKRGRPRKDSTNKENKDEVRKQNSVSPSSTATCGLVSDTGCRYGLRGVKLSSVIMRAEKGIGDNVEEKIYQTSFKTEIKTEVDPEKMILPDSVSIASNEEAIPKSNNNSDVVNDDQSIGKIGHDSSTDNEWTQKRKPGRPRKKFKMEIPRKVRKVIDLGDNIPIYKRRQRNNVRSESCKYCAKMFCDYTGVDCHVRRWHMKEEDVEEYLDQLKELKIVTCRICNTSCVDRIQLQIHENRYHFRNETVKCKVCKKMYKNIQSLRNHTLAVHGVKGQPHLCHHCPAKFKWAMTLKQHIEEIHEGKMNIICKVCNKKFARKSQLTRHERIHGSDESKRLVCPTCGKGFWYECNYQRHLKIVHGPVKENFHCSYCGKGFNLKSAMVSHVQKVHLNIYPFRCPQCKIGLGRRKLLEEHMAQAHNMSDIKVLDVKRGRFKYGRNSEDLFYCSHCSLSFCYKTKMVEHMHIDHGTEFPFMCEHCCQGFLEKHFLTNHLKKAHNDMQEEEAIDDSLSEGTIKGERSTQTQSIRENADMQVNSGEYKECVEVAETKTGDTLAEAASVLLEVASGNNTIHYVQLQEDGETAVVSQELSSLLLAAEQSLQLSEGGEVELSTSDGQTLTYIPQGVGIGVGDLQTVSSNIVIDNVHMETEVCSNNVEVSSENIEFSSIVMDTPNSAEIPSGSVE